MAKTKAVKRGQQFDSFSQGSMHPQGNCTASGGAPGDSYTPYSGMNAITEDDLKALFDDAEVSLFFKPISCLKNIIAH